MEYKFITERSETTVTTTFIIVLIIQKCDLQGESERSVEKNSWIMTLHHSQECNLVPLY